MKKLSFILFVATLISFSCSNDETTQEEESVRLEKMRQEIIADSQINSKSCTNPEEWAFTKFDPSNCSGYIIYNKQIDVAAFKKKVDKYVAAKGKFNLKWGVLYDCMPMPTLIPSEIECLDGKPVIKYVPAEN